MHVSCARCVERVTTPTAPPRCVNRPTPCSACVALAARRTIDATCFGPPDAPWRFVSLKHDDDGYVYYFGILHLCFTVKIGDETHECILVEYVWPDMQQYKTRADDGIPLYTRYVRTPTKLYEVLNVERVLNCAPLVAPPRFGPPPRNPQLREHWVLNEDVYGNF